MPENYSVDFWNKVADTMNGFGPGFFGYEILKKLICKIDIPNHG